MRVFKMARWMGLASAVALASACSDAPTSVPSLATDAGSVAFARGDKDDRGKDPKNFEESAIFTIVPGQPVDMYFGNFRLQMPANALCAQNQGYGREYWNQPCELEKAPVKFVATWVVEDGAGSISFNHDRRFDPKKVVIISVRAKGTWKNTDAILWLEGQGSKAQWVDEGKYDRDMKTYKQGRDLIWRRLKHFSGYNVTAGECDPMDLMCGNGDVPLPAF